ncbi:MAG: UbiH/UbiF/VisC/COQ6 family ubiquinone biosynthesis hydroxylase [Pseudomonadota bacterium]
MAGTIQDVVVVGGGLIGSALAAVLAQAGARVSLIDRLSDRDRADPAFDGRAYAFSLGSARLVDRIGLWAALEPDAQPICGIQVGEGAGSPVLLHFDPRNMDEARIGWIVEDHRLRRALIDAPAKVDVRAPAAVRSVQYGPGAARLHLDDGNTLAARLVVAADGRRSAIAREAGVGRLGWSYGQNGLVAAIEHAEDHEGVAHQSFFPGGPFAVLPLSGRRSSIVWSECKTRAEALMALDEAAYAAELRSRIGVRLGDVRLVGKRWAYPLDLTLAERYCAPRLALIGDAAHGVHPIAGQGMNMGLRDVAALAETVVEAARRGEDMGSITVLERYERWRRFDATAFALGMDALNRLFSNGSAGLSALRQAGLGVVSTLDPLKRALMREATGQAGVVPRLLRGQPL